MNKEDRQKLICTLSRIAFKRLASALSSFYRETELKEEEDANDWDLEKLKILNELKEEVELHSKDAKKILLLKELNEQIID